jgi:hypothetical protein
VHSSADPRPAARDDETDLAQALARAGIRCSGDPVTLGRHADRPVTRWSTTRGDLVAKVYPSADTAARAYDITMALWHSSFGARRSPPGLAEPVLHLADCAAVVCRHVPGDPLPGNSAAALQPWLPSVGALLADLHNSRCGLPRRRDARAMLRSMTRKAADLEATPLGPATLRVAALLHMVAIDRPAPERRLVPTHGDAAPNNLLAAGGLRMLDWDRAAMADPGPRPGALRRHSLGRGRRARPTGVLVGPDDPGNAYARRCEPPDAVTLELYLAFALVRIAHGWTEFRTFPERAAPLLDETERILLRLLPRP